jgi:branched-chain amino acid transport system ATP-binding protein
MATPALAVDHLCKRLGALEVTRDVSMQFEPGARHAIIGPNGAGKTTLVNQISGLIRPSSGRLRLFGADIGGYSPERRVAAGLVRTFQINSLFLEMTVGENLRLAVVARRRMDAVPWTRSASDREISARVIELLEALGLTELATETVGKLAYGKRRLIEIAIALALEPKVLLLDEPAAGVSRQDGRLLLSVLQRLPKDLAIIIIEHDMGLVFEFAAEITVLVRGAILARGGVAEIRADHRVRDVYLGRRHHG